MLDATRGYNEHIRIIKFFALKFLNRTTLGITQRDKIRNEEIRLKN